MTVMVKLEFKYLPTTAIDSAFLFFVSKLLQNVLLLNIQIQTYPQYPEELLALPYAQQKLKTK
jgi:hypothetical protein